MTSIMGYEITKTREALDAFLAQARQKYAALAQAIAPIDEKVGDLQKDWEPRPLNFWRAVLQDDIPAIREATQLCLLLFDREQSTSSPMPIIICATSLGYRFGLHPIDREIDECGICLTAYLHNCSQERSIESQIREQQRIKKLLQRLSTAVHTAIQDASTRLSEAPEQQRLLLGPPRSLVVEDRRVEEVQHAD